MKCIQRLGLALAMVLPAVACLAPDSLHGSDAPLVAASNMLHPPFSSWGPEGRAIGIEVDIVDRAARQLGREVLWVELPFSDLLTAVASGEVDIAASTLGITEARKELVAFTDPYFTTSIVALVRIGPDEPKTLDALKDRRVATERGTTAVDAGSARIPFAQFVLERPEGVTWAELLASGKIDAIVLDASHAATFMAAANTRFHIIEEALQSEPLALAVSPGRTELLRALNFNL